MIRTHEGIPLPNFQLIDSTILDRTLGIAIQWLGIPAKEKLELERGLVAKLETGDKWGMTLNDVNGYIKFTPKQSLDLSIMIRAEARSLGEILRTNYSDVTKIDPDHVVRHSPSLAWKYAELHAKASVLAVGNIELVPGVIKHFASANTTEDTQDLFAFGYEGLYQASLLYDPWFHNPLVRSYDSAANFRGLATQRIRWNVLKGIYEQTRGILSQGAKQRLRTLRKFIGGLEQLHSSSVETTDFSNYIYLRFNRGIINPLSSDVENLVKEMKSDRSLPNEINRLYRQIRGHEKAEHVESLDETLTTTAHDEQGNETTWEKTLLERHEYRASAINPVRAAEDIAIENLSRQRVRFLLSEYLKPKEIEMIERYAGINGPQESQVSLTKEYNVSPARISTLLKKLIRKYKLRLALDSN